MLSQNHDGAFKLPVAATIRKIITALAIVALLVTSLPAYAQDMAGSNSDDPLIELNLPEDLEVDVLIDYVSKRLKMNIIYDETVHGKKVTIKSPRPLPRSSLLGLVQSSLQMKGLTLVDMPQDGWMKVVASDKMISVAGVPEFGEETDQGKPVANRVITLVFELQYLQSDQASNLVKPFLTVPGGNSIAVPAQQLLIITDLEQNIIRLKQILELADQPIQKVTTAIVPVVYADAESVARMIKQISTGMRRYRSKSAGSGAGDTVDSYHDPRTNRLILIGPEWAVNDAVALIRELDVPVTEERSPIRFYKLVNSTAEDVLETIRMINEGGRAIDLGNSMLADTSPPSPVADEQNDNPQPKEGGPPNRDESESPEDQPVAIVPDKAAKSSSLPSLLGTGSSSITTTRATVTADTNTNSIIVVGDPAIQQVYKQLIRRLDQRRPQVLIETTIVAIDTSDGFELSVDILGDGTFGSDNENSVITFSSFGVSTVDENTGMLTFNPRLGFNGVVFGPDIANVAITALKKNGRVKVVSAPKLLINDNAEGILDSTLQEPYSEVVNASSTLATTTFGGTADAGTKLTVTPHISEHEYLQLKFKAELSAFRGERIENLPPPTQKNSFESEVTIPDGYTIVVGGLKRDDYEETINAVPVLGELPIIKHLFRSESNERSETTLFVFIRPTIVKEDNFNDLKYLSELELKKAELPGHYPASEPLMIQ